MTATALYFDIDHGHVFRARNYDVRSDWWERRSSRRT